MGTIVLYNGAHCYFGGYPLYLVFHLTQYKHVHYYVHVTYIDFPVPKKLPATP